jgi:hypothetical protein
MPRYLLLTSGVFSALMLIGVAVAIPALNTSKSIATDTSETCDQYNDQKTVFRSNLQKLKYRLLII